MGHPAHWKIKPPLTPEQFAQVESRKAMLCWVVIVKQTPDGPWLGYVENSFSMSYEPNYVRVWATFVGVDNIVGATHQVDGHAEATYNTKSLRKAHPDWEVAMYAGHNPEIPISIDWDKWYLAEGKYGFRNAPFKPKEGQ